MTRYAAEPLMFKGSSSPAYDTTQGIGPNPGDLWIDMSVPVLKRMTQKNPDVWISVEGGGGGIPSFADNETPSGSINGSNVTFTLAHIPNPSSSLNLYLNGNKQLQPTHYSVSGTTITMVAAPATGDNLSADYRF